MVHSDAFQRMWSTTFRGSIECGNIIITEITLIRTLRYNVKLLASGCFFYSHHSLFEHTLVFAKDMTYSLNCISVLLFTQSVYFVWAYFPGSLPQYKFIFKINNQFQTDVLFEVSIILKDIYIISPFDIFVLFYNVYSTFLKHSCRQLKLY